MRENLSAPGTLNDWMVASENALWNAGFDNVGFDPDIDRLYGDYGTSDYIDIDFSVPEPGRVRLEIEASDRAMIEKYKQQSVREIRKLKKERTASVSQIRGSNTAEDDADRPYDSPRRRDEEAAASGPSQRLQDRIPRNVREMAFYTKTWFVLLMLVVVPPVGIFLLFYNRTFKLPARIMTTLIALMYTLFIWVGFFGVNTGFNKDTVNMWYKDVQSQITRMFNQNKTEETTAPATTTNHADETTSTVNEEGVTEVPVNQNSSETQKEPGFFEKLLTPFKGES